MVFQSRAFARLFGDWVISAYSAGPGDSQGSQNGYQRQFHRAFDAIQSEVERLEKQQQQSQELYNDGLISRVEFEKGEKELADARAKVEQVTKEIAVANQPALVLWILLRNWLRPVIRHGRPETAESMV